MLDVLLIGEPMGLFIGEEYGDFEDLNFFSKGISGAEINVATSLARQGFGVSYISKLGEDPFGHYIEKHLENEGVSTDYLMFDEDQKTGLQIKNRVTEGDPKVSYYRKDSAFTTLSIEDVDEIDFSDIQLLHITGIPLAVSPSVRETVIYLAKRAKEAQCLITFDPNLRPALCNSKGEMVEETNKMTEYADVILPSLSEGQLLTGKDSIEEVAEYYLDEGIEVAIIKDGGDGAYIHEKGKEGKIIPGYEVEEVVDTVGAGDGFASGVISGYLDQFSWDEAVLRGNAIGSLQVQHKSDNEALPTKEELKLYMNDKAE